MANSGNCKNICWVLALVAGLLVLLLSKGAVSFIAALMLGVAFAILTGLLLTRFFCSEADAEAMYVAPSPVAEKPVTATPVAPVSAAESVKPNAAKAAKPVATKAKKANATKPAKAATAKAPVAKKPAVKKTKAKTKDIPAETPDYDGDGVHEGTGEGTRPAALAGPRNGKADDLKQIKGVGPKLEVMLNEFGFYHFDQIAGWSANETAWVNANLKGFKGRATRDNWIEQASVLAKGGATEFSKRVEDGSVY